MAKLDNVVENVLRESVVEDAAELVGIEKEDVADRISGLSFANYLELGNAVDIEDVETAREILGTVSEIEESYRSTKYADMDYDSDEAWANDKKVRKIITSIKKNPDLFPNVKWDGAWVVGGVRGRDVAKHFGTDLYELFNASGIQTWVDKYGKDVYRIGYDRNVREDRYDEEKLLDKPTPTLKDLAKKHDMSLGDMGAQLAMGIKAEKEHTSDMLVALDHLNELPDYYTKLEKMEEADDITGGPSTKISQRLVKYIDKNIRSFAKQVARNSRKSDVGKPVDWWLDQISKSVMDSDEFNDYDFQDTQTYYDFVDAWNNMPEYYANLVWNHLITKYKAFKPYSDELHEEEAGIEGKRPNKSKNYSRKGGNKQQYKWLITLNNGKSKTTWADSRYNAIHGQLSPEQHIIGVKSAVKLKESAQIGVYRKSKQQYDSDDGHTSSASAEVRRGGKHVTFKNKKAAYKWIADNSKGETLFARKVSKSVKEADNPFASAPSDGSSIDALKSISSEITSGAKDAMADVKRGINDILGKEDGELGRKEVSDLSIGDDIEVIDISGDPTPVTVKNPRGPGETLIVQTDKGEEHMIKKMAVSGTPALQESAFDGFIAEGLSDEDALALDSAVIKEGYYDIEGEGASLAEQLGTYGWIVYISWKRDDLDFAMYKNIDKDNNRGDYRFLKVDKATGSWQTQRTKYNDDMPTESGDAAELMHVIKAIEASATVEEGQNANKTEHSGAKKGKGAYYGQKKTAKRDSNKKRRANDKQAVNEGDSFFFFLDPDGRGDGATVMSSKGDIHDHYDDTETAMQEVRRLNAEFGKDNDGNAIGVEEGKWDYKSKDRGRGAGTDSPMYDGGAKNRKNRKAFRKAEKAKAHQARMRGEVDESVLSDHVKVEYTDPKGRFIVVTAGNAGHWAVGQGNPYGSGIEQWSHSNLDDAINQADADADDLDNLREMKRMAGIQETSSAGGTGAGAIASAPAAMNGIHSRTQSIYGKTNKKPKPKERAKESTEDGIGRNKK